MSKTYFKNRTLVLSVIALLELLGIGSVFYLMSEGSGHEAIAAQTPPAVAVTVQTVNPQNIRVWSSYSGRMQAIDYASIRPEVGGRITEIRFRDGQTVTAGDVLLVIDPQPYQAAMERADANVAAARTKAEFAKTELGRAGNLIKSQAIAQRIYDERVSDSRVAQADIKVAEAALKQAKIDLDHAYVKAPISGRVSRAEITVGNLVQTGPNAPVLTSIVSNDGIYADFEVDEQTYMKSIRTHTATQDAERAIPVELTVQGDDEHPYQGFIYAFDNRIDSNSGTIRARAKFTNDDGTLMPGMFVSVKLASGGDESAMLVPERAIGSDQSKKFVYVVGSDSKVVYREVTLGQQANDGQRIVLAGLKAGERVIVDGLQHIRPDMSVQVKEAALQSEGAQKL